MLLINQLLRSIDGVNPGVPAFVGMDGDATGYREFAATVRRLAGGIARLAPDRDATIGILALNSRQYIEVLLAAAWAGRVAVPLNTRWALAELAHAADEARIGILFADEVMLSTATQLRERSRRPCELVYIGSGAIPATLRSYAEVSSGTEVEALPSTPDTPVAVIYTGGTTGVSKGAVHTHRSLLASALNCLCMGGMPRNSRCLVVLPMFHSGAIGLTLAQLLLRGTIVTAPLFRPDLVHRSVTALGVDTLLLVPTMLAMLLDESGFNSTDYASVRAITYGASPMPVALLARVQRAFPKAALCQIYGMTEVGIAIMLTDHYHRGADARPAAAGQPGPFYNVRIAGPDRREVARGTLGEVVFEGPGLMQGYLNQPDSTSAVLRDDGLYSGDIGFMDDAGVVTLVDRQKDMVVTGGENVYSAEVENAIASHPAVAQCAVIGVPDATFGERVHAVLILRASESLTLEQLREHCAASIAGYKCPRSMETRPELPLSPMGKVLKARLREEHWTDPTRRVN